MLRRHSRYAILIHWFNAVCWLFLLFSGLGLLANPLVQPVGAWWASLWINLFGGEFRLLSAHVMVGSVWVAVCAVYLLFRSRREVVPFLYEVFHLKLPSDFIWCLRKGMRLIVGEKAMRRLGLDPTLPSQGFYNAGQKLAAIAAVLCSVVLAATGCGMAYLAGCPDMAEILRWCLVLHFCAAAIMMLVLPIHIYMAACVPGEGPALRSMFTGFVPEDLAKRHDPLWYAVLKGGKR